MEPARGQRLHRLILIAVLLLICSLAVGYGLLDRKAYPTSRDFAILAGPLATAGMLFVALGLSFPNLLPEEGFGFPLNLTLPVVYVFLVRIATMLWTSPQSAVFQPGEQLRPALLWTNLMALATLLFAQCLFLTIFRKRLRSGPHPVASLGGDD